MPKKPSSPGSTPITSHKHADKRANIPTEELRDFVADDEKAPRTILYPRDPSLDPQLVWKGKDEQDQHDLEVPAVPVYIQEKISPQAIIENVRNNPRPFLPPTPASGGKANHPASGGNANHPAGGGKTETTSGLHIGGEAADSSTPVYGGRGVPDSPAFQLNLFNDFNNITFEDLVDFYHHEQNWTNRMILGDSLLVMTSLAEKEGLKGRVQMIYLDPPYGIKFGSNWQVSTRKRDVKDGKEEDATRQPEQIKAFRDTWELGIHSYLAYLRDRLTVARDLLTESGSVFVQIGDENVHLVRCLMDEVFGSENFLSDIVFRKTGSAATDYLANVTDHILWFAKNHDVVKYRSIYSERVNKDGIPDSYSLLELTDGSTSRLTEEMRIRGELPKGVRPFQSVSLESEGHRSGDLCEPYFYQEKYKSPRNGAHWKTSHAGLRRLGIQGRLLISGNSIRYKMYLDDFPVMATSNIWVDTMGASDLVYVVQTNTKVVERCLLMTTDPGDLVLDPTCLRAGALVWVRKNGPSRLPANWEEQNTPTNKPVRGPVYGVSSTPVYGVSTAPADGEEQSTPTNEPVRGPVYGVSSTPVYGVSTAPAGGEEQDTPTNKVIRGPVYGVSQSAPNSFSALPPSTGGSEGGAFELLPIEQILPGDEVISHDGQPHRVLLITCKPYTGEMVGIHHHRTDHTLWVTTDHRIMAKPRPQTLGGHLDWSGSSAEIRHRARELRREMTPAEIKLWNVLRNKQAGYKFRRQHPLGPYIADFYSREAQLVVEVDGDTHFTPQGLEHDHERDRYLQSLGLGVLHVTNDELYQSPEGVYALIQDTIRQISADSTHNLWHEAGELEYGDLVYHGAQLDPVGIDRPIFEETQDETVYDLMVEGAHSFLTEVCMVHNCGSGTTAYVAEQWGRRWITVDTSRVSIALARTRLMAGRFPYYLLADSNEGVRKEAELSKQLPPSPMPPEGCDLRRGFVYKRVPHITLKAIANNEEIDRIHAQFQPDLDTLRHKINQAAGKDWPEWEIPREVSKDLAGVPELPTLLPEYWALRRARQKEIDASIARRADTELLYDQPYEEPKRIRVTGPFTVESLSPHRVLSTDEERPATEIAGQQQTGAGQFEALIIENLRAAGVQNTKKGERLKFTRLESFAGTWLHAVGEYEESGPLPPQAGVNQSTPQAGLKSSALASEGNSLHLAESAQRADSGTPVYGGRGSRRVAVCIGPEHGTVGPDLIKDAAKEAVQGVGFDLLVVLGFAFDPHVSEEVHRYGRLTVLPARINPDLQMGSLLLKKSGSGNLFMVFGEPDLELKHLAGGKMTVTIKGVDIYDPTTGEIRSSSTDDIACWFIDTDYNGESFFVRHAYFTGADEPYDKLKRALRAEIDESAWSALYATTSYPFDKPHSGKIAVKVINHYGDEVLKVYTLPA